MRRTRREIEDMLIIVAIMAFATGFVAGVVVLWSMDLSKAERWKMLYDLENKTANDYARWYLMEIDKNLNNLKGGINK